MKISIKTKNILVRKTPTINPYREAANMIYERLLWDTKYESWKSRRKLRKVLNKYEGQKAVILCNGPSLLKSDLSILSNTFTFGLNKINLLFKKSKYRPNCIVAVNPFVIDQNSAFYNMTDIDLFINSKRSNIINSRRNVTFLFTSHRTNDFARDCSMSVFQGSTVTYVALQLAFHMGFKEVALIGCDHHFEANGKPNAVATSNAIDKNHFDPNYFSKGVPWQLPDLQRSELYYTLAREVYQNYNRKIFNATEGGKLEVFPRKSLEDFLDI
jgi:hypothetical protein